jgi:phage terminase small subunit
VLTAPERLSPAAREVFNALAAQVAKSNPAVPTQVLTDLLAQYADAHAVRELAARQLATDASLFAVSPNGVRYPHPAFKVIEQAERTMDRTMRRMGYGGIKADAPPFVLDLDDD